MGLSGSNTYRLGLVFHWLDFNSIQINCILGHEMIVLKFFHRGNSISLISLLQTHLISQRNQWNEILLLKIWLSFYHHWTMLHWKAFSISKRTNKHLCFSLIIHFRLYRIMAALALHFISFSTLWMCLFIIFKRYILTL